MHIRKTAALSVSTLVLLSGLVLVGAPLAVDINAATNQPQVSVESAELSDTEIDVGESVEVTATVRNEDDTGRSYPVALEVDGQDRDTEPVFVGPDSSETVTFEESFETTGSYDISVNDVAAGELTVVDPEEPAEPEFEVSSASVSEETIQESESISVDATVENVGDGEASFVARLMIDGEPVDSTTVTLGPDESESVSFDRAFDESGEYDISVDDTTAGTVTVLEPASVSVTDAETGSDSVTTDETLSVEATVENQGDLSDELTVELEIDGGVVASTQVEVAGGESESVEFAHEFDEPGERSVSVNGEPAGDVSVLEPASLSVTDAETGTDSVTTDESLAVEATVENQGEVAGEMTVELEIDGGVVTSTQVEVAGGETETVEFAHEFDEPGERSVSVNGEPAGDVSVRAPAEFEVSSASVNEETIEEDESVSITATVENVGDGEGTFEADLVIDGEPVDSTTVTLGPGESESVSFDRTFDEAGEYDISVGETTAGTVTVLEPASLSVTDAQVSTESVTTDESLTVEATVENQGDLAGDLTVELEIDGSAVASTQVEVDGGETDSVEFTHEFDESGERTVSVNGESAGDVSVLAPAEFDVFSASASDGTVLEGESVTVTATVENIGDVEGTYEADLEVDGDTVDATSLTLDGGESGEVSFDRSFENAGTYDVGVSGVAAGQVDVDQPATVSITETTLTDTVILENNSVGVEAGIENTGDRSGTFELDLLVDGDVVEQQDVSVAAGDTTTVTFEQEFTTAGSYEVSVSDATVGTVTVDRPATLELTSVELAQERVLQGDPAEVVATVENSGDRDGEFTAEFAVENSTTAEQNLTVAADDTETIRFTETFDDVGEYALAVNGRTAGSVAVEEPPTFEVVEADVPADWAAEGTMTAVRAVIENPSNWTATRQFNVTVDDEQVATEDITLDPGEQTEATIEFEATGGTVAVNGVDAGTLDTSQPTQDTPESNDEDGSLWGVYGILALLATVFLLWSIASARSSFR